MRAFCNTRSYFHMEKTALTKNFCHGLRILAVKRIWYLGLGVWGGGLSESVKKGKFVTTILFSDNFQ